MANKNIKGITIEIGGSTTGLDKALKGVESNCNKAKSELRDVDKALKNAPDSAVLWAQKQELLTKALEESKKKLETLKGAQKQVNEQFEKGEIGEEQYRAFQREVEYTKSDVDKLGSSLSDTNEKIDGFTNNTEGASAKVAELGDEVDKTGDKSTEMGEKSNAAGAVVVAAGAAMVAAAKECYDAWAEVDDGYDTIITKTGASGVALEELQKSADKVFTSLPVEMSDVGTAIGEVNTRFGSTGDELETITEKFLKFSKINGTDVNSSIDNVSASMKAFGLDTSEAGNVLGVLTDVGQKTGIDMSTLESKLAENSATFKEMNLGVEESAQLLGQFELNGVDTSTALAGLKKAQQNATEQGKSLSDALNENITAIKTSKDDVSALQTATDLFGKKGAAAMTQAIKENRFTLDGLSTDMNKFGGVVDATFDATQDAPDKLKVSLNKLKLEGTEIANKVLPKLSNGADWLIKNMSKITDTAKKMLPVVEGIGAGFLTWKAINGISSGIGLVKNLSAAIKDGNTVMKALNKTMGANPAIAVAAGVVGLTGALISLVKANQSEQSEMEKIIGAQKKYNESIQEEIDALNESTESANKSAESEQIKYEKAQVLWQELDKLADSQGKVSEKDQARAEFIINQLGNLTGTEIEMIDGQIQKYSELKSSIESVIEQKKAEAVISALESTYSDSIQQQTTSMNEYNSAVTQQSYYRNRVDEFEKSARLKGYIGDFDTNSLMNEAGGLLTNSEIEMYVQSKEQIDILQQTINLEEEKYKVATDNVKKMEEAQEAYYKGDYESAIDIARNQKKLDFDSQEFLKQTNAQKLSDYKSTLTEMENSHKLALSANNESEAEAWQEKIDALLIRSKQDGIDIGQSFGESYQTRFNEIMMDTNSAYVSGLNDLSVNSVNSAGDAMLAMAKQYMIDLSNMAELYSVNNLIKSSINSASDVNLYQSNKYIPQMAKGGYISSGSAIVAEAGPELLTIMNGGVQVTPLSESSRNTAVGGTDNQKVFYNSYSIVVDKISSDYDVRALSQRLAAEQKRIESGKGK